MTGSPRLIWMVVLLIGASVGTGWTADGFLELVQAVFHWPLEPMRFDDRLRAWWTSRQWSAQATGALLWTGIGIALLVGSLFGLFLGRHGLLRSRASVQNQGDYRGRSVLIMGLSSASGDAVRDVATMTGIPISLLGGGSADVRVLLAQERTPERGETLAGVTRHPWRQNLRAIYTHLTVSSYGEPLRKIIVIPSIESAPQAGMFKGLVLGLLDRAGRRDVGVEVTEGIDYENFDDVTGILDRVLAQVKTTHRGALLDGAGTVCIDITSGTKIFSVGAATMTMNRDLLFSYVNMAGVTVFYDARVLVLDTFGA
ncbi:MAG: hypothetical protein K9H25_23710 [Rhodospirillum sp.]|nr:hypothetical protein [Rhodospirillum sp.]MCF8492133.1 hypothetical protein [Rhodospirillum sp.]MCF8501050.1 hypothetical protein [Rhodospirillum sp.]